MAKKDPVFDNDNNNDANNNSNNNMGAFKPTMSKTRCFYVLLGQAWLSTKRIAKTVKRYKLSDSVVRGQ